MNLAPGDIVFVPKAKIYSKGSPSSDEGINRRKCSMRCTNYSTKKNCGLVASAERPSGVGESDKMIKMNFSWKKFCE